MRMSYHPLPPPQQTSSNLSSTSPSLVDLCLIYNEWHAAFGGTTKKTPHYKLGERIIYPRAVLSHGCPTIYLAHTQRSCVNICQRM